MRNLDTFHASWTALVASDAREWVVGVHGTEPRLTADALQKSWPAARVLMPGQDEGEPLDLVVLLVCSGDEADAASFVQERLTPDGLVFWVGDSTIADGEPPQVLLDQVDWWCTLPEGPAWLGGRGDSAAQCVSDVQARLVGDPGPLLPQTASDLRRRRMMRQDLATLIRAELRSLAEVAEPHALSRIRDAVQLMVGPGRRTLTDTAQRAALAHFPGLPAVPWVDPFEYEELAAFATELETNWKAIRDEVIDSQSLQSYLEGDYMQAKFEPRRPDDWKAHDFSGDDRGDLCPVLSGILRRHAALLSGDALASSLAPQAGIPPHTDDHDYKLTLHLGLSVPDGATMTVDGERRTWTEGRCLVFSDAYVHSVENNSEETRLILLIDIWHPLLAPVERAALARLREVISPASTPRVFERF